MKFPRLKELTLARAVLLFTIGMVAPLIIGGLMLPFFNFIFIFLLVGWIPYSVWLALCYYYRRKDHIDES
jgi:hypothetical protein